MRARLGSNYSFKGNSHRTDVCLLNSGVGPHTMSTQILDFFWDHVNWVIAIVSFACAFSGIVRKTLTWAPPGPLGLIWPTQYLSSAHAKFVGYLYLIVGFVALFSTTGGMLGFIGVSLLAWFLGSFWPER